MEVTAALGAPRQFDRLALSRSRHITGYVDCCRVLWKATGAKGRVPISDYACSAPIHFGTVLACAAQDEIHKSGVNPSSHARLSSALTTYLHAAAAGLQQDPSDICWFVQVPYNVGGSAEDSRTLLSNSASSSSPECCLSGSVAIDAASIECLILSAEHDFLQAFVEVDEDGPAAQSCSTAQPPMLSFLQGVADDSSRAAPGHKSGPSLPQKIASNAFDLGPAVGVPPDKCCMRRCGAPPPCTSLLLERPFRSSEQSGCRIVAGPVAIIRVVRCNHMLTWMLMHILGNQHSAKL